MTLLTVAGPHDPQAFYHAGYVSGSEWSWLLALTVGIVAAVVGFMAGWVLR